MSLTKYAIFLFFLVALAPLWAYALGALLLVMSLYGIGGHVWAIARRKASKHNVV